MGTHRSSPRHHAAAEQGRVNQARGNAVEAATAEALRRLAQCLDTAEHSPGRYRVITSVRVPPTLPGHAEYAKTEWDAILLRRADDTESADAAWDVCLLAEAKASVDAATTDLPRLARGLRLLGSAQAAAYPFETREGTVWLRGASLATLEDDEAALPDVVLYCCDAPAEPAPRLLGAAHRMQLLSAPASLAYANGLASGKAADPSRLAPVWTQLLEATAWRPVLTQYTRLRQVRALMVHVGDLVDALG